MAMPIPCVHVEVQAAQPVYTLSNYGNLHCSAPSITRASTICCSAGVCGL